MPSDEIDRQILLKIPNANDMTDDELAQALLGIDWTSGEDGPAIPSSLLTYDLTYDLTYSMVE